MGYDSIALRNIRKPDSWEPTPQLRWIRKPHPHGGWDVELQQLWRRLNLIEWRPVPGPD